MGEPEGEVRSDSKFRGKMGPRRRMRLWEGVSSRVLHIQTTFIYTETISPYLRVEKVAGKTFTADGGKTRVPRLFFSHLERETIFKLRISQVL